MIDFRIPIFGIAISLLTSLTTHAQQADSEINPSVKAMQGHFVLRWNDEFDGESLDVEKWFYRTDNKHRSIQRRENVSLVDGNLRLDLLPMDEPIEGKSLSGAGVVSRQKFRYGYYEVRAKLGDNRDDDGDGLIDEGWHHAFWAMAAEGDEEGNVRTTYPGIRRTEIDCYEYASDRDFFTQHVIIWKPDGKEFGRRPTPPKDKVKTSEVTLHEWHTYGFEWNEKACRFYIDGKLNRVGPYPADKFEHDELNIWLTAISANWNKKGGEKSEALYDYVRFFESDSDTYVPQELKEPKATVEDGNLAQTAEVTVSSTHNDYVAEHLNDGIISDDSRWLNTSTDQKPAIEFTWDAENRIGGIHLFSGYGSGSAVTKFQIDFFKDGKWKQIPSANISGNKATALRIPFDANADVTTDRMRIRFLPPLHKNHARIREVKIWAYGKDGIPQIDPSISNPFAAEDAKIPKLYLNQSGFNTGKPKRFTAPLVTADTPFEIRLAKDKSRSGKPLYSGTIQNGIGDFTNFDPNATGESTGFEPSDEFVVIAGDQTSVPFSIRNNYFERITYDLALEFMVDSRHYVGNYRKKCRGSYAWRDDHHFAFTLNTLVPQFLSNPSAYQRAEMCGRVKYENPDRKKMGALQPYDNSAPDIVKLIHFNADIIVTQKPEHMLMKEQLAYFLYAWPWIKQWCPQQNYDVVLAYVNEVWDRPTCAGKFPFNTTQENHNLLEVKKEIGTTKGESPPGHSILPNLLMYEVAKREGDDQADKYFRAARAQTEWLIKNVDWNDPLTTKGQRMSEHVTMSGLGVMALRYADRAPAGLQNKLQQWVKVALGRSDNMWDFRKLSDTQWTPTGDAPTHWNEPGNVMGFPACALSALQGTGEMAEEKRLRQLIWSHIDNCFGRNPCGRHYSYDGAREIPGVEFGWYSFYRGGVGQLENVRFVFDGAPKNEHYPYNPGVGNVGWTEGWVNFNTAFNHSLAWMAFDDTEVSASYANNELSVKLKAPLNFDDKKKEIAEVMVDFADGSTEKLRVTEMTADDLWFEAKMTCTKKPIKVSYGFGYLEKSQQLGGQ